MPLGTGDFETVGYSDAAFPPAPRVPQHVGRAHRSPLGFGNYPAHYAPAPPAPNSLSPVAMAASSSAVATGPQRAQHAETLVIRSRPSPRAGMMILLTGALIGGLFGVAMHGRQGQNDAAFAAQPQASSTPPPSPMANGLGGPAVLPQGPPAMPPTAFASPHGPIPGTTVVIPPSAAVAIGVKEKDVKKPAHGGRVSAPHAAPTPKLAAATSSKKEKDSDDGWTIASAGGSDRKETTREVKEPKPEPRESKAERAEKPEKAEKTEKTASKKGGSKSSDDANAVLKAAMGATENTL